MKYLKIIAALGLASFLGCTPASGPATNTAHQDTARALTRGVVESAETVWMGMAKACIATGDEELVKKCGEILSPIQHTVCSSC